MARRRTNLAVVEHDHLDNLGDIQEFAESLPEKYLHCRDMGHNWRPFSAGRWKDGGFERTLRCVRCKARRIQGITSRGIPMSSRYEYPDGYQAPAGTGLIVGEGRGLLRLESIRRLVGKDE